MTDEQAIRSVRLGQHEAFEVLVRRYEPQALAHAGLLLGRGEDARDAVQDSFFAAFRALRRFDPRRSFYPWFYVILRNRCRSVRRRQRLDRPLTDPDAVAHAPDAGLASEDDEASRLRRALGRLPADDREILALKYMDGRSYDEIGAMLDLPAGTVASRLHAARRRLAALLPHLAAAKVNP